MRDAGLRALRRPNFRCWFVHLSLSSSALWVHWLAQDWLVLELTDGSGTALGVVTALQFVPFLVLGPLCGVVADRYPKWATVVATQLATGLGGLALGLLVAAGAVELWHVFAIASLMGACNALWQPTAQAFVPETVPSRDLGSAVALCAGSFNVTRLLGAGAGGLFIGFWGTGPVLLVAGLVIAASVWPLLRMDRAALTPGPRATGGRLVRGGLAYVRGHREIRLVLAVVGVVAAFGLNSQLVITLIGTQEFGGGPGQLGLLGACMAVGSLAGAAVAATTSSVTLRRLVTCALLFCGVQLLAALSPSLWVFAVLMAAVGATQLAFVSTAATYVQFATTPVVRGRVMAVYLMVFLGSRPLGAYLMGWAADTWNAPAAVAAQTGAAAVLTVAAVAALRQRLDAEAGPDPEPAVPPKGSPEESPQGNPTEGRPHV